MALITGAGSDRGLGYAIARALARAGAEVVLSDIDVGGASQCGGDRRLRPRGRPRRDERGVGGRSCARGGAAWTSSSNAGISQRGAIWELWVDEFDRVLAINLRGGFLCLGAVVKGMMERRWGRMIWISSVAGK